jgi:glutaredoxin-like protein NrdH
MPDIKVYGSPGCQQCRATERWLESRGHQFTYVHLEQFPDAAARFREQGHTTLPVVSVSWPDNPGASAEWSGFRPSVLETALGGVA